MMKKYIINIAIFFALIAVMDFGVGSVGDYWQAHAKGVANKEFYDLCKKDRYDIIIMGSSRVRHHYDPMILEDSLEMTTYNAGYDGNGIILADGIYRLISKRYHPKLIVYDLTQGFDSYEYTDDNNNLRYLSQLKPCYSDGEISEIIRTISNDEYYKVHSGLYRYNLKLIQPAKENLVAMPIKKKGYAPLKKVLDYEPSNLYETADGTAIDSTKLFFMEDFIRRVQSDSVQLVLYMLPRYKSTSRQMFAPLEQLSAKHHVSVIDLYNDLDISTEKTFFEDVAHLNETGATVFTKKLCTAIKHEILTNLDNR